MFEQQFFICVIAFILGWIVCKRMGNSFSVAAKNFGPVYKPITCGRGVPSRLCKCDTRLDIPPEGSIMVKDLNYNQITKYCHNTVKPNPRSYQQGSDLWTCLNSYKKLRDSCLK